MAQNEFSPGVETKVQRHHIKYDPEWIVELQNYLHRTISIIQRAKPTQARYAMLTNFVHSVVHEWNRYREALDTENE